MTRDLGFYLCRTIIDLRNAMQCKSVGRVLDVYRMLRSLDYACLCGA
jgi:hypothetical protein